MTKDKKLNFSAIEKKWQAKWNSKKAFQVSEKSKKQKFYILHMFPYPSGSGLHMGHAFNYTISDVYARFKRMQGFNVLYPVGYDSLGLPAENAAIKEGVHPKKYTEQSIKNFMNQEKSLGLSYDWSRMFMTHNPEYYKWDQWIFLKMYEKGLAYKKKAPVNYCRKCDTVLANEQVVNGKCWRHDDTEVEIKHLEQWYFKITEYADELLSGLDKLDWPERIKAMQRNWIGKSYGAEIDFEVNGKKWPIFTTRPDTIYGVTFMVVSAQHPRLSELVIKSQKTKVDAFLKKLKGVSEKQLEDTEKEGVFTGSFAENPLTKEKIPIYAGNFVLADYGSGMVMGVPAHDQRDWEFAKKYKLSVKQVIDGGGVNVAHKAHEDYGVLNHSGVFSGLHSSEAKEHIIKNLEEKGLGRKKVHFKLRDWLISRQRYWGTPIPIIYCDKCGIIPISEKQLPVKLPEKVKFGKGNPLETVESWISVKCPKCKSKARRETDTMDTFVNSSWYFLRYCDSKNKNKIFDEKKVNYWCPINQYVGGATHATLHLIYFRFYTKFLRDLGLLKFDEPALRLFNQGMIHGEDGYVMSKSRGNIIDPLDVINKYSTDVLRLFLMSMGSPDKDSSWSEKGIEGSFKFVKKVVDYISNFKPSKDKVDAKIESLLNKTIKEVTEEIEGFRYNLAVINIRRLFDAIHEKGASKEVLEKFLLLLSPFCPHIAEELWSKLGNKNFISTSEWPKVDEKKIDSKYEKEDEAVESVVNDVNNVMKIVGKKSKVFIYTIPNEKEIYSRNLGEISKRTGLEVSVYAVNDKDKYDPASKSKKAKPGKPGIYLE